MENWGIYSITITRNMFQHWCSYYCFLDSSWLVVCSFWLSLICSWEIKMWVQLLLFQKNNLNMLMCLMLVDCFVSILLVLLLWWLWLWVSCKCKCKFLVLFLENWENLAAILNSWKLDYDWQLVLVKLILLVEKVSLRATLLPGLL